VTSSCLAWGRFPSTGREHGASIDSVTGSALRVKNPRTSRRQRETRLLDAAAHRFARFGFDKTSIDEIASDAGVSKGAVYLHWPSKDALFEATLIREGLRLLDDLSERIEADPAGGTLAGIYRHGILSMGGSPLLLAVYTFDAGQLGDYIRRSDPAIYTRRFLFGEEFIRRMQAAGLMRADLEPGVTAYVLGMISFGMLSIRQLAPQVPAPSLERLADGLADLVSRGLATQTDDDQSSEAGKRAFRALADETKRLYTERTEAARGNNEHPSSPS
jgi:AcrR family transcriptional regulator